MKRRPSASGEAVGAVHVEGRAIDEAVTPRCIAKYRHVEACVVRNDNAAIEKSAESWPNVGKCGGTNDGVVVDAVYRSAVWVEVGLGVDERRSGREDCAVADKGDSDGTRAAARLVGGLEVDR